MKQYTVAFREQVLRAIDVGLSRSDVAQIFGVSASTIGSWQQRQRQQGNVTPSSRPGRPPRIGPEEHEVLLAQIRSHPMATVAEHRDLWEANQQVRVSVGTMHRALKSAGWRHRQRGSGSGHDA
jgi:transposase